MPADVPQQLLLPGEDSVVRIAVGEVASDAAITLGVADPGLAQRLASAITEALAAIEVPPHSHPTVLLRSRKRLGERVVELNNAIAIIGVTPRNARHLVALIEGVRAAGVIGVQLVWDGASHERFVFGALEHARGTPAAAPVVVAETIEPAPALRLLVEHHHQRQRRHP